MRNLTIERRKSFVASMVTMKVYIEDAVEAELTINNYPCKKLGELKNGETNTFEIPETDARVFVIADKASSGFCNEMYSIPAGTESIFLSGENKLNPASGNAFVFDGNTSVEAVSNRKHVRTIGLIVLCAAIVVGAIVGVNLPKLFSSNNGSQKDKPAVASEESKDKTFSSNGMNITLPDTFREMETENYTVCYDTPDEAILALREDFSLFGDSDTYTLDEYAEMVLKANEARGPSEIKTEDGIMYFGYDFYNENEDKTFTYLITLYKAPDAFWMVQFVSLQDDYESKKADFFSYAKTISFDAEA